MPSGWRSLAPAPFEDEVCSAGAALCGLAALPFEDKIGGACAAVFGVRAADGGVVLLIMAIALSIAHAYALVDYRIASMAGAMTPAAVVSATVALPCATRRASATTKAATTTRARRGSRCGPSRTARATGR